MERSMARIAVLVSLALGTLLAGPGLVPAAHGQTNDEPNCPEDELAEIEVFLVENALIPDPGQFGSIVIRPICVFVGEQPPGGSQLQCPSPEQQRFDVPGVGVICLRLGPSTASSSAVPLSASGPLPEDRQGVVPGVALLGGVGLVAAWLHRVARRQLSTSSRRR